MPIRLHGEAQMMGLRQLTEGKEKARVADGRWACEVVTGGELEERE